jgi:hypothetical protein
MVAQDRTELFLFMSYLIMLSVAEVEGQDDLE